MLDFTAKIFLIPAMLYLVSKILPGLYFPSVYSLLLTGAFIAVLYTLADFRFLNTIKNPRSTIMDWGLTVIVLLSLNFLWPGVKITIIGALLTATVLGFIEYSAHVILLKSHH